MSQVCAAEAGYTTMSEHHETVMGTDQKLQNIQTALLMAQHRGTDAEANTDDKTDYICSSLGNGDIMTNGISSM